MCAWCRHMPLGAQAGLPTRTSPAGCVHMDQSDTAILHCTPLLGGRVGVMGQLVVWAAGNLCLPVVSSASHPSHSRLTSECMLSRLLGCCE